MILKSIQTTSLYVCTGVILGALLIVVPLSVAQANEEDAHEHEAMVHDEHDDADRAEMMKQLVAVLQQLVALLKEQAQQMGTHMHDEHADEHALATTLSVKVEVHGDRTHIHAQKPGGTPETFFLDDVVHTDEVAVIAAVSTRLGVTEAEVEAVILFPEDGDDHESTETEDEHEHEDGDDDHEDLDGIHIMADGTVMLGNGDVLEDATVNDEGMIVLADGTEVEPEMDLR